MKTISRRWVAHFFERRPGLALPRQNSLLDTLEGTALGLLRAEAQRAKHTLDMDLAEGHTVRRSMSRRSRLIVHSPVSTLFRTGQQEKQGQGNAGLFGLPDGAASTRRRVLEVGDQGLQEAAHADAEGALSALSLPG